MYSIGDYKHSFGVVSCSFHALAILLHQKLRHILELVLAGITLKAVIIPAPVRKQYIDWRAAILRILGLCVLKELNSMHWTIS
ncbi:MAG: hypothetical protein QCH31_09240 [Methanolobus sp.]|nr:hypothetical protein [Methanolobus sp.]